MYGATVLYYIYLLFVVLGLITLFAGIGTGVYQGSFILAAIVVLMMLPSLLFTGWVAFVLGKCRKSIEEAVKKTQ